MVVIQSVFLKIRICSIILKCQISRVLKTGVPLRTVGLP